MIICRARCSLIVPEPTWRPSSSWLGHYGADIVESDLGIMSFVDFRRPSEYFTCSKWMYGKLCDLTVMLWTSNHLWDQQRLEIKLLHETPNEATLLSPSCFCAVAPPFTWIASYFSCCRSLFDDHLDTLLFFQLLLKAERATFPSGCHHGIMLSLTEGMWLFIYQCREANRNTHSLKWPVIGRKSVRNGLNTETRRGADV